MMYQNIVDFIHELYGTKGFVPLNVPKFIGNEKKYLDECKIPNTRFDIKEAIDALNASGAIPVWAHPLGGEGEEHFTQKEFLPKLEVMKNYGIKGLECFYSRYSEQEEEFLLNCAKENNLLISGGSDYHGTNKKNISLAKLNTDNNPVDINSITLLNCLKL